ncbi:MAG: methylated-DNA--[protein]-cysteine S-methyltransferase [Gaiellaceae bacterium]
MRAEQTRYAVPRWGVGELWTRGGLVLANEFVFHPVSDTGRGSSLGSAFAEVSNADGSRPGVPHHAADSRGGAIGSISAPASRDTNRCLTPDELVGRLTALLEGDEVPLDDVPLDLSWTTPFQHAVATSLREIPRGEIVSYGELAALAGYPGAQRAVGSFCARNRFVLLVPCHRVVGAAGIGGYGSAGVGVKRRLLALEGVVL